MHPSVLIFDKIRTNKNFVLLEIWIGKHRIISGHLKPASYLHCQTAEPSEAPQGSRCVVVKKAEDQAVGEAASGGSGEPVG